jgi:hypothetical protein
MSTHLLNAGKAAWVSEAASGTTYNDRPTLALDGTGADEKRAFIWFPNPVGRLGDSVLSATLTLYLSNTWSGTTTITVKRVTASWRQDSVKWGSSGSNPAVTTSNEATATVTSGVAGDAVPIDVTAILSDVAAGGAWYGLRIEVDAAGPLRVHSPDSATPRYRPTLLVDMSTAPDAPDGLKPNGTNRADSEAPPVFYWQFNSSDAVAYQTQSRLQISTTEGDYSTPLYDSDWESNDQTSWDPSDGTIAAVPELEEATTYYWRVSVRDQNGLESDWSDEATFIWRDAGDVQIVDPAGEDDAVYDNTPTITWYTNGLDQRSVRIKVWRVSAITGDTTLLYTRDWAKQEQDLNDDGEDVGYDTFTIPSTLPSFRGDGDPIIATPGATYRVEVAVRDEYNRRDDDYVSDTRDFVYTLGNGIAAPTGLTVASVGGVPTVDLTWTHSGADKFVVYRNGNGIAELDADEVSAGGNDYAWTDYTAKPGIEYSYDVAAKNDGVEIGLSASSSTVTVDPVGFWLMYPDEATLIPFMGDQEIAQVLAETSISLAPTGRQDPVRIVSRIGSYEGSASGTLIQWNGTEAADHLSNLEYFAGELSTKKLRLVFGVRNIAVNIGGLSVSQDPTQRGIAAQFRVSFNWWQVGSFSVSVN